MGDHVGEGRAAHAPLAFTHSVAGHALQLPEIAHALVEGLVNPCRRNALARGSPCPA